MNDRIQLYDGETVLICAEYSKIRFLMFYIAMAATIVLAIPWSEDKAYFVAYMLGMSVARFNTLKFFLCLVVFLILYLLMKYIEKNTYFVVTNRRVLRGCPLSFLFLMKDLSVVISGIVTLGYGLLGILGYFLRYRCVFVRTVDMHTLWIIPFVKNWKEIYAVLNEERLRAQSSAQKIANFTLNSSAE